MSAKKHKSAQVEFGRLLAEKRVERGYSSAYRFYHGRGGRSHFQVTYQQYLRVEKGARLPSVEKFEAILDAIGSVTGFEEGRQELMTAYLRALVGGSDVFRKLFARLSSRSGARSTVEADAGDSEAMIRKAVVKLLDSIPNLTAAQVDAFFSSPAAFWLFQWLLHTGTNMTTAELARRLHLEEDATGEALARLTRHKLVRRDRKGRYHCPHFEADIGQPYGTLGKERCLFIQQQISEAFARRETTYNYGYHFMTIESDDQLPKVASIMRDALHKTYLYRERRRHPAGRFIGVEYRLTYFKKIERD